MNVSGEWTWDLGEIAGEAAGEAAGEVALGVDDADILLECVD